jgi:hypothetical protein
MILSRQQLKLEALRRIGVIPPAPQPPKAEEKPEEKPKPKRKRKE